MAYLDRLFHTSNGSESIGDRAYIVSIVVYEEGKREFAVVVECLLDADVFECAVWGWRIGGGGWFWMEM